MLTAKEASPLPESATHPGWLVKRHAAERRGEPNPKLSLLHLLKWRRAVFCCASAAQLANPDTQRVAAVLALRAEARWALAPRPTRGCGGAMAWSKSWLRGLLRVARGAGTGAESDAPGWRAQAGVLVFEGGEEEEEEAEESEGLDSD